MKAIDVLNAAKETFEQYGDERYAIRKANNFLNRCGAKLELGLNQEISKGTVEAVAKAMLDADAEQAFWAWLLARV